MKEVRCPGCGRLLAVMHDNGKIECRIDRRVIETDRALLTCLKCGGQVEMGQEKSRPTLRGEDSSLRSE